MYKVVHKPWGKEEWLELNDSYCYKRIYINSGYKTSYQYHNFKKETNYIIEGKAEVWLEDDEGIVQKKIMGAGDFFNVTPTKKAQSNCHYRHYSSRSFNSQKWMMFLE